MNFSKTWPLVLAGIKTQTRRSRYEGETLKELATFPGLPSIKWVVRANGHTRWTAGRHYAVCAGRGRKSIGSFILLDLWPDRVSQISEEDARAEGFDSPEAFQAVWRDLYGSNALDTCWALKLHVERPRKVNAILRCRICKCEWARWLHGEPV
jgi:hypothetical protein